MNYNTHTLAKKIIFVHIYLPSESLIEFQNQVRICCFSGQYLLRKQHSSVSEGPTEWTTPLGIPKDASAEPNSTHKQTFVSISVHIYIYICQSVESKIHSLEKRQQRNMNWIIEYLTKFVKLLPLRSSFVMTGVSANSSIKYTTLWF